MQKKSLIIGLGLTGLTSFLSLVFSLSPSLSQSTSSAPPANKVTFFCRLMYDPASGGQIPFTIVWVPERHGNVRFIGWKSEYFNQGGWTPEKRCQQVTQKFQEFYSQGRLNLFSTGMYRGYPIICSLANQEETCNGNNQLFTLKTGSKPEEVVYSLMDIAEGKNREAILQNSNGKLYISVKKILSQAPLLENK